jgi:hypothetical protein
LTLESKTGKLLASEITTKLGKGFSSGAVLQPVAAAAKDPRAMVAVAALGGFEKFINSIGARGGKLQLPTVVKHCTNAVLRHTKPK